LSSVQAI